MNKSKHTPGPWTFTYPSERAFIDSPSGLVLITDDECSARTEDVRLIAAAPELLEALKALLESTDLNLDEGMDQTTIDAKELAIKAIQKAGAQ